MINELRKSILENTEYYRRVKVDKLRFRQSLHVLLATVDRISDISKTINGFACDYDLDEKTKGNGHHSFVYVCDKALNRTAKICRQITETRESFFFRISFYQKEIESCNDLLQSLLKIGDCLVKNHNKSEDSCLFSEIGIYENSIKKTLDSINKESFYGRNFGFHVLSSLTLPIWLSAVFIASYSEGFYSNQHILIKLLLFPFTYLKYLLSSQLLSKRLVNIFNNFEIKFSKSLLKQAETRLFHFYQEFIEHDVPVNKVFEIPTDPLQAFSDKKGEMVDIPIPSGHIGVKPIACRLLSARQRKGMIGITSRNEAAPLSKYLIIHVHGGGWITQSSKFHGSYLREWAATLDVPIMSIDYSLAPKAAFPRALDEIFYAYCWALKNPELVGSTGENIVFVGDSAGGNLVTACTIKCIELGIRKPKGLLNLYSVFLADYVAAPSRFLCCMDVILPYTIYMRLFPAYLGKSSRSAPILKNREVSPSVDDTLYTLPKNYLLSPQIVPNEILREFPINKIVTANLDPCLDENVEFAKRLRKVNVDVHLDVLEGLVHGFLNLSRNSFECHEGSKLCMRRLAELLGLEK